MRKAAATATNASETEGAIIKETIQNSSIISSVRHFVVAAGQHLLLLLHLLFALLDGQNNGKRGGIIEPTHTSTPSLCACVRHWLRFAFKESLCKEGWGGKTEKEAQSTQQNEIDKNVDRGQHKNWWILLQHWVKGMLVGKRVVRGRLDWHRAWVWFVGGEGRKLVLRFV